MTELCYLDGLRSRLDKAEKLFASVSDLVESTAQCLSQTKQNLAMHENVLDGCQYIDGLDPPEIGVAIREARVGVRYYQKQIRLLEKYLNDYRAFKNKTEDEWKTLNSESIKVRPRIFGSEMFSGNDL